MFKINEEINGGWPIYALTLKEILTQLGFEINKTNDIIYLNLNETNNKLLGSYPILLEDDGMGYGINPQFITLVDKEIYEEECTNSKLNVFNLWKEKYSNTNENDKETD